MRVRDNSENHSTLKEWSEDQFYFTLDAVEFTVFHSVYSHQLCSQGIAYIIEIQKIKICQYFNSVNLTNLSEVAKLQTFRVYFCPVGYNSPNKKRRPVCTEPIEELCCRFIPKYF